MGDPFWQPFETVIRFTATEMWDYFIHPALKRQNRTDPKTGSATAVPLTPKTKEEANAALAMLMNYLPGQVKE